MISAMQIYEWTIGVDFSQDAGSGYTQITNCEIECWTYALNIQLPVSTRKTTAGIKVTSCTLAKASDSNDGDPIVIISANGNPVDQLNDIALVDCAVFNMYESPPANQHGLEIVSGSNIRIIGGTYSNNSSSGGAGIAITGGCTDVQIIGANLQPSYPGAPTPNNQQYGLLVSGSPTGAVLVSGCDMTGYTATGSAAVKVTAAPSELLINNCPGYNDQNTSLSTDSGQLTVGVSAATCLTPYFGPSVITFSNPEPISVHVFGQTITSTFGVIFLPSPYDVIKFISETPVAFSWTGK